MEKTTDNDAAQSESVANFPRAGAVRSRATKRASLACVQCRSRHVKCNGDLPACQRCCLEKKTCYYAPSRRGIRDPVKRNMMRDEALAADLEQSSDNTPSPDFASLATPALAIRTLPGGWSVAREPGGHSSSRTTFLFDLYYTYFQDTHSWLPPKQVLARLLQDRPEELSFIAAMIAYIGSVYTDAIDSTPLREKAFQMANATLPKSVWNVQALVCTSIAAFGEGSIEKCGLWFQKAVEMALELGLQHKGFADAEEDPVLAESYRRTYWALYVHGSLRTVREHHGHFLLFSTPATTDLPCEEWEYQSGEIPTPMSLADYDTKGSSISYSSWAYLVALVRVVGQSVVPLLNVGAGALPEAVDHADHRIISWLLQLPHWKKELVDPDGAVDMILFHALGIAHGLRIRIQLQLHNAGVQFRASDVPANGPIFHPSSLLPQKVQNACDPWLYGPAALQASLSLIALFKFHLPPEKLSPSCIFGLERATLPLLDAYYFGGMRTHILREKIMLLANVLRKSGEFWPLSKSVSEDVMKALEFDGGHVEKPSGAQHTWEHIFDELIPSTTEQDDIFHFPQPMTTGELNSWAAQRMNNLKADNCTNGI